MITGIVTPTGPAIMHAGVTVPLPPACTPFGAWLAATIAAIDAGEIVECAGCGRFACECESDPDPHGDLSDFQNCEIPF